MPEEPFKDPVLYFFVFGTALLIKILRPRLASGMDVGDRLIDPGRAEMSPFPRSLDVGIGCVFWFEYIAGGSFEMKYPIGHDFGLWDASLL